MVFVKKTLQGPAGVCVALLLCFASTSWSMAADDLDAVFSPNELRDSWSPPPLGAGQQTPFVLTKETSSIPGIFGMDVSHHNTDCSAPSCVCILDWSIVAQHGVRFAYLKSTTGTGTVTKVDRSFSTHWNNLSDYHQRGRIYRGAYHWLTSTPTESGRDQANYFLSVVKPSDDQLPPALDFEEDPVRRSEGYFVAHPNFCKQLQSRKTGETYFVCDGWREVPREQIVQKIRDWLETVSSAARRTPMVYTRSRYWADMLGPEGQAIAKIYPVWVAQYPVPPSDWYIEHQKLPWHMPKLPEGSTYPVQQPGAPYSSKNVWQFTDKGLLENSPLSCDGKIANSAFDLDWFPATNVDFVREFGKK